MNIPRMLNKFEEKHGDYDRLINQYIRWSRLADMNKSSEKAQKEAKRYDRLLRNHDKLIWAVMGYHEGLKEAKRKDES